MKKIMLIMVMLLLSTNFVVAEPVPEDVSAVTMQKIDVEHKTTRQFITNELTKREKLFMNDFTSRADYYEKSFEDLTRKAVLQLGLLWGGLLMFFISFGKLVSIKTEQKKYQVLKDAIKKDIIIELKAEQFQLPEKDIAIAKTLKESSTTKKPDGKKGFFSKFKQKKEKTIKKKPVSKENNEELLKTMNKIDFGGQPKEYAGEQKIHQTSIGTSKSLLDKMKSKGGI